MQKTANIGLEITNCPYCNTVNNEAVKRVGFLNFLRHKNKYLNQKVRKESRPFLIYRTLKRIKWMLLIGTFAIFIGMGFTIYIRELFFKGRGTEADLEKYYTEGNLEELYFSMSYGGFFAVPEYKDYAEAALVWNDYNKVQTSFAESYQYFMENGLYKEWELETCIENGIRVLTADLSFNYRDDLSEENKELLKPYKEEVYMLFTGVFQIPEEMLVDLEPRDYGKVYEITEYVFSVLSMEDD